jgi:uncharacterized protein (DUF1015 family)
LKLASLFFSENTDNIYPIFFAGKGLEVSLAKDFLVDCEIVHKHAPWSRQLDMSIIRPFCGLRVKPDLAAQVTSPPYDTMSTPEARIMAGDNPNSFLRIDKPEIEFPDLFNPYDPQVYARGRQNLDAFQSRGVLLRDPNPCFYMYRQTMDGRRQTGLLALTSVAEYNAGKIKKHEHTRPEKVNDRANHIIASNAQASPVLSTFKWNADLARIFDVVQSKSPLLDFVSSDQVRHEFWVIADSATVDQLVKVFDTQIEALYIADGHHRSEAASEVCRRLRENNPDHTGNEPYNFFLNGLFADRELYIMPYNRVVRDLNNHTLGQLLTEAEKHFEVDKTPSAAASTPISQHQFGLYAEGNWYRLKARAGSFDPTHPVNSIDAAILAENLISPLLGVHNPRTDKRIDFVGGIRGVKELERLVDSGQFKIAFSLYSTSISQLLTVADAGEVMPPKSTWFEPKLRSGLVVNLLSD